MYIEQRVSNQERLFVSGFLLYIIVMVKTRCDAGFHRTADETHIFATHTTHVPRSSEQLILSLRTTARKRRDSMKKWLAVTCKDQYHLERVPTAASYPRDSRQVRTPTLTWLRFIFDIPSTGRGLVYRAESRRQAKRAQLPPVVGICSQPGLEYLQPSPHDTRSGTEHNPPCITHSI